MENKRYKNYDDLSLRPPKIHPKIWQKMTKQQRDDWQKEVDNYLFEQQEERRRRLKARYGY